MENITYGYVRVSSKDQNIERQLIALKNAVYQKNIFISTGKAERILIVRHISPC